MMARKTISNILIVGIMLAAAVVLLVIGFVANHIVFSTDSPTYYFPLFMITIDRSTLYDLSLLFIIIGIVLVILAVFWLIRDYKKPLAGCAMPSVASPADIGKKSGKKKISSAKPRRK